MYGPKEQVFDQARVLDAIPYDIPDAEYSHYGDECTFDFIIKKHQLTDPALLKLATIIRGADTDHFEFARNQQGFRLFSRDYPIMEMTITKCLKRDRRYNTHL